MFFPLGLTITLVFFVIDVFLFLAMETKMLYMMMVELRLSVVGSLFFKLKEKKIERRWGSGGQWNIWRRLFEAGLIL